MLRRLNRIVLHHIVPSALLLYFGFGFILWYYQDDYIFHPDNRAFGSCPDFHTAAPITYNGTRAYYRDVGGPLVVLYHGNAGNACDRSWYAKEFFEPRGYSYLFVEYTGYARDHRDTTSPSVATLTADAQNTADFLTSLEHQTVLILSESLGALPASVHASITPPDLMLLTTPPRSLTETARTLYPIYPVQWLLHADISAVENLTPQTFPIHIVHGTADTIIPIAEAEAFFTALNTLEKTFTPIDGAAHHNIYDTLQWQTLVSNLLQPVHELAE